MEQGREKVTRFRPWISATRISNAKQQLWADMEPADDGPYVLHLHYAEALARAERAENALRLLSNGGYNVAVSNAKHQADEELRATSTQGAGRGESES